MSMKILVPFVDDNNIVYRIEEIKGRHVNQPTLDDEYILDDELHEWMLQNKVKYSLGVCSGPRNDYFKYATNTYIKFKKKKDAMLFKLTWG
jgi:hypothetical protein